MSLCNVLSCINVAKLAKVNVAVPFFCMESMSPWLDTRFFPVQYPCKLTDSIGRLYKRTQFLEEKSKRADVTVFSNGFLCHCQILAGYSTCLLLLILLLFNLYNVPTFILALSTHGTNARSKLARWYKTKYSDVNRL